MPQETSWANPKHHMVVRGITIVLPMHRMPSSRSCRADPGEGSKVRHSAAPGISAHPLNGGFDTSAETFSAEPADDSDASGTPKADGDFFPLDDYRHLAGTPGDLQHRIQVLRGRFHIDVIVLLIGFPSLLGVRSPRLAVDANRFSHSKPPSGGWNDGDRKNPLGDSFRL